MCSVSPFQNHFTLFGPVLSKWHSGHDINMDVLMFRGLGCFVWVGFCWLVDWLIGFFLFKKR